MIRGDSVWNYPVGAHNKYLLLLEKLTPFKESSDDDDLAKFCIYFLRDL